MFVRFRQQATFELFMICEWYNAGRKMKFSSEKRNRGAMGRYNRIMMLVMGAAFGFPISASAFTSIPALNFPALQVTANT